VPAKVSVIIPSYNCAEFIAEAVESALSQSYGNLEVIVVNDGSSDDTAEVLAAYRGRIIYLEQPNLGAAAARNAGIARATGELIAFLDADDVWLPTKLEQQLAAWQAYPEAVLVYTQMVNFDHASGAELGLFPASVPSGDLFERLLVENLIPLPTVLVKASVLREVGCFDEGLVTAEDTNLWLKIARRYRLLGLHSVLVRRRKHSFNLSDRFDLPVGTLANLDRLVSSFPEISPESYPPMRRAYLVRGGALMVDYFCDGKFDACHRTCARLLKLGAANGRVWGYFLLTSLPEPLLLTLQHAVRDLRGAGRQTKSLLAGGGRA